MRPNAREYRFQDKFIAVVDILGFSSKVEAAERGNSDVTLSDLLSYGRALAQEAHAQMIADSDTPPPICPNSLRHSRGLDYEVTQVSDGVVVSSEVSPSGLVNLLQHVSLAVLKLLASGVMVRGYVLRGTIFHDDWQFLGTGYQEAMEKEKSVQAFRLAEDDGGAPFVEIDQRVVRYAAEKTDGCVQSVFRALVEDDGCGHTVVFPYRQLLRIALQAGQAETVAKNLEWAERALTDFLDRIEKHSPRADPQANAKAKHLRRVLRDQLAQCDRIKNQTIAATQESFPPGSLDDLSRP